MADLIQINNGLISIGGNLIEITPSVPSLPPYTIRLRYNDGVTPTFSKGTGVQVSSSPNVWDLTYNNTSWGDLLTGHEDLLEVMGANTTGIANMRWMFYGCSRLASVSLFDTSSVTIMRYMFYGCSSLTSVPLFNTSSATDMSFMFCSCSNLTSVPLLDTSKCSNMQQMFDGCSSLTSVPLFDTSSATTMISMFQNCSSLRSVPLLDTSSATNTITMFSYCIHVESGALALYQQASSQANPPEKHSEMFRNCGYLTTSGAAELAQIPGGWK